MKVKNWFLVAIGVMYFMSAIQSYNNGNKPLAVVTTCYGISQFALSLI